MWGWGLRGKLLQQASTSNIQNPTTLQKTCSALHRIISWGSNILEMWFWTKISCLCSTGQVWTHTAGQFNFKFLIFLSGVPLLLTGLLSYQWLGFLLIFVIVQPLPAQNKPATVPRFDESPLLPEPPAPDDTRASVHLTLASAALGAVVGRALLVHHGSSYLWKQAKLVGNPVTMRHCCYLNFHYLSN